MSDRYRVTGIRRTTQPGCYGWASVHLGSFDNIEDAIAAYEAAPRTHPGVRKLLVQRLEGNSWRKVPAAA